MLLALIGDAGVGKDTVAALLAQRGFQRISFADPIKKIMIALAPYLLTPDGELLSGLIEEFGSLEQAKRHSPGVREIMMQIGGNADGSVGFKQIFGNDFWIEQALKDLDLLSNYVVTDCSFQNEADLLAAQGARFIKIYRAGHTQKRVDGPPIDAVVEFVLRNDGTVGELEGKLSELLAYLA